ncbi:hypothetical protein M0R45_028559 [Rubus argutus]|uniref:Uncharacterized protein n=1 Tax=Rubus argutus TaxID=59490 RepID=A0AAW1W7L6_RUBAR
MPWWRSASAFRSSMGWNPRGLMRWMPELSLSLVVDDVVWSLVTAFESVALVSMLFFFFFFFVFCGCTV